MVLEPYLKKLGHHQELTFTLFLCIMVMGIGESRDHLAPVILQFGGNLWNSFLHSFIQQIHVEHLLCTSVGNAMVKHRETYLVFALFELQPSMGDEH